jgi:hypothetical protein
MKMEKYFQYFKSKIEEYYKYNNYEVEKYEGRGFCKGKEGGKDPFFCL